MEQWVGLSCYGLAGKYAINNAGIIKTIKCRNRWGWYIPKKERIIKPFINKDGYEQVSLYNIKGKLKSFKVHRLVAIAFIRNPKNKPQVNHLNSKRSDNRAENLEWCTQSENQIHSVKFGNYKIKSGEASTQSKLKEKDVLYILNSHKPNWWLANKFKIHIDSIQNVKSGKTWSEITGILPVAKTVKDRSGSNHYLTNLTEKDVIHIYKSTEDAKSLAVRYRVGKTTIYAIRKGQNWRHLTKHEVV